MKVGLKKGSWVVVGRITIALFWYSKHVKCRSVFFMVFERCGERQSLEAVSFLNMSIFVFGFVAVILLLLGIGLGWILGLILR